MKNRRDILAACDLSAYSLPVLRLAGKMAADLQRNLIVAHVIHRRNIDSVTYAMSMKGLFNPAPSPEAFVNQLTQERLQELQGLIQKAEAGSYIANLEIMIGDPFETLLNIIKSRDVYMAVIGNKGRGSIAGLIAGSTAEKMLSHCPVPLLCVPQVPGKNQAEQPAR